MYALDLRSGRSRRLAQEAGQPAYSPDGTRLAYPGFGDGNAELYVARVDGSRRAG